MTEVSAGAPGEAAYEPEPTIAETQSGDAQGVKPAEGKSGSELYPQDTGHNSVHLESAGTDPSVEPLPKPEANTKVLDSGALARAGHRGKPVAEPLTIIVGVIGSAAAIKELLGHSGVGWLWTILIVCLAFLIAAIYLWLKHPAHRALAWTGFALCTLGSLVSITGLLGLRVCVGQCGEEPSPPGLPTQSTPGAGSLEPFTLSTTAPPTSPGVELVVEPSGEPNAVLTKWTVLADPPPGHVRFVFSIKRQVDPSNPHDDYYPKWELGEKGSTGQGTVQLSKLGYRMTVTVLSVDERCASDLRGIAKSDLQRSVSPCVSGENGFVVSNSIDIIQRR